MFINIFVFFSSLCLWGKIGTHSREPFAMGEALNGKNKVDINTEMRLAEQKSKQLIEQGCSAEETEQAMEDFGSKRFFFSIQFQNAEILK